MSEDINARLIQHNSGKVKSTKAFMTWELVYFEKFDLFEEARKRELFFKTSTGRRFLKAIKNKTRAKLHNPRVSGSPPVPIAIGVATQKGP